MQVRAFGSPPLNQMTEDILRAYKTTIDFWAEDFKMKPLEFVKSSCSCLLVTPLGILNDQLIAIFSF